MNSPYLQQDEDKQKMIRELIKLIPSVPQDKKKNSMLGVRG